MYFVLKYITDFLLIRDFVLHFLSGKVSFLNIIPIFVISDNFLNLNN